MARLPAILWPASNIDNDLLPFNFNNSFVDNYFNFTQFSLSKTDSNFGINFTIPTYTKHTLSKVFSKPTVLANKIYMYNNTNPIYVSKSPVLIAFTYNAYKNNCLYANKLKKVFCKNSSSISDCNRSMLESSKMDINSKCIKELLMTNVVTQVKNDLHFTIVSPIDLNVTCTNKTNLIQLEQPTKFVGISNCTLFTNDMIIQTNISDEYRLIALPYTATNNNKYKMLYYFYLFVFCFLLVPNLIFPTILVIRENGNRQLINTTKTNANANTYSSFQTEETEFIVMPRTYRETLI